MNPSQSFVNLRPKPRLAVVTSLGIKRFGRGSNQTLSTRSMTMLPLLPRTALHLLNAFIVIAILFILFFPTLTYTKSIYRPSEDISTDASFPDKTVSPSILMKFQQSPDDSIYEDNRDIDSSQTRLQAPPRVSVLTVIVSTFRVIWSGILLLGQFMSFVLHPLQIITVFLFNKFVFLLQPFIIMGTGLYTVTILWPIQIVNYLAQTFYPIYIFLACASIVGLIVGGIANLTTTYLNNTIFPPQKPLRRPPSRPKTSESESVTESVTSSRSVTPTPIRPPPPSKFPSTVDDMHILDTNALFSSFSLPIPPATPPGILYSAPTPVGSVSGGVVVGETIFEEEDDSDEKTPVATATQPQESWGFGAGKPLTRAESAHGRMVGQGERVGMETWHGKIKREDVDAQGIDWGDDGVRRRKKGVAV